MSYIYVASPYSSQSAFTREQRYHAVLNYIGWRIESGEIAYSPIVHCHPIACRKALAFTYDYWMDHNKAMLRHAKGLDVVCADGWDSSIGVRAEIDIARSLNIPTLYAYWEEHEGEGAFALHKTHKEIYF